MELSLQSSGYVVQKMPRGVLLNLPVEDKRTASGTWCGIACFCKQVLKVSSSSQIFVAVFYWASYIDHETVQLVTPRLQNQSYTLLLCQRICACTELLCSITLQPWTCDLECIYSHTISSPGVPSPDVGGGLLQAWWLSRHSTVS